MRQGSQNCVFPRFAQGLAGVAGPAEPPRVGGWAGADKHEHTKLAMFAMVPFCRENDHLPRQAQDKHKGNSQRRAAFDRLFLQRGEREWPKMYSQLLGSRAANAPEKVVVCSPGLGDRLFNTNVAEKFKGHYYLSSERLYYDVQGRLKSKYFS